MIGARGIAFTVIAAAVALAVACSGEEKPRGGSDSAQLGATGREKEGRPLSPSEIDTLRAMKTRLNVTRDEYFDGRGGVLGTDWAEVWYPEGTLTVTHGMYALDQLWRARGRVQAIFGKVPDGKLTVVCSVSMPLYTKSTGNEWWQYSRIKGDEIVFQPIPVLFKRGIIDIAIRHEVYKWSVRKLSGGHAPRWIEEGFASYLSGEEKILVDQTKEFPDVPLKLTQEQIDKALRDFNDRKMARMANYNAYRMTKQIADTHGRDKIAAFILALGNGDDMDAASGAAFGLSWDYLVSAAREWDDSGVR